MRELEHLLPDLEPPAGGLARLQRSVRARSEPPLPYAWRRWLPATVGAATLLLLAVIWLPGFMQRQQHDTELTHALQQAIAPRHGIQVIDGAALALPSGQADVRIYLVQTRPPHAATH